MEQAIRAGAGKIEAASQNATARLDAVTRNIEGATRWLSVWIALIFLLLGFALGIVVDRRMQQPQDLESIGQKLGKIEQTVRAIQQQKTSHGTGGKAVVPVTKAIPNPAPTASQE